MIAHTLRGPHNLYRRYQGLLEQTLTVSGLALLVILSLDSLPVYPKNWVIVIGVGIGLIGLRWPFLAYFMAVAVLIYPLYTINLYLAVLFVAVSVLGQRLFVHYMGATVLVLATPLLAKYHLHWLIPILGGLWWGGITGLWVGALAAIWGKFLGGLTGLNTDWLVLAGQVPDVQVLATRLYEANSLETLILLIEPFATTATIILYNLLQIAGWAIAGAFVGTLAQRKWIKYRTPWSILVITAGGGLIMLATHLALPYWLQEALTPAAQAVLQDPTGPLFSLMMVILVGTTVYSLRESLDLPVAPRRARTQWGSAKPVGLLQRTKAALQRRGQSSGTADFEPTRRPIRIPHQSELPEWEPPKDDTGLIMLEID